MILTIGVLSELMSGGPNFETVAKAVEKTPDPAITAVTLASLVRHVRQHHDVSFKQAVDIVERLLGEIGARVVPINYEIAIGAAKFGGRLVPGETSSIDDAFAFAAGDHLAIGTLAVFDILGLDGHGEEEGRGAEGEKI